jgi:lipoate-protein ligase A
MPEKTFAVSVDETNPYKNIAREALLMEQVPDGAVILYLWQNRHTVVIGRSQNAWTECRFEELEKDGGFLARRLSGGGAVYHDLGNLNFTFLTTDALYDVDRQSEVILRAVRALGVDAVRTGRNDIETAGRKFSGNAFYHAAGKAYHHGTILVSASLAAAQKYLSVSKDKIESKGVESVKSRIINLTEINSAITIDAMRTSLVAAFDEVYGRKSEAWLTDGASSRQAELEARFSSPDWKYGKNPPFAFSARRRFSWGGVEIRLDVQNNTIQDAAVFSDAMDEQFILALPAVFRGAEFRAEAVAKKLTARYGNEKTDYSNDILALLFS